MTRTLISSLLLSLAAASVAVAQPTPITPAPGIPAPPGAGTPITPSNGSVPITGANTPVVPSGNTAPANANGTQPTLFNPIDPRFPLAGHWRFKGNDRSGPFEGSLIFQPTANGNYAYQRRFDGVPSTTFGDNGTAELTGTHLYTKQVVAGGLSTLMSGNLGGNMVTRPRHGFYRLKGSMKSGQGFYYKTHLERGPEKLFRVGSGDNNHVQLLVDGKEMFPQMRASILAAQRSITMQFFIFNDDMTGKWVGELLAEKARQGVDVKLLFADYGTWISDELMTNLRSSGATVILQGTQNEGIKNSLKDIGRSIITLGGLIGGKKKKAKRGFVNHDHRKMVIVDGRYGFIGGMNIMDLYEHDWHDIHSKVEGNVVRDMEALFYSAWHAAGGEGDPPAPDPIVNSGNWWPGNMEVELVDSVPGVHKNILARYMGEIMASRDYIHIENAYFLHDGVIGALKAKARAGVEVKVIIPKDEHNDVSQVVDAFKWIRNDVIRSGIRLYTYRDRMTHGKVAVFDGVVCTVGSANLDDLALEKLYEANLFVRDIGFSQTIEDRIFNTDFPNSDVEHTEKNSIGQTLKSGFFHFFKGFL